MKYSTGYYLTNTDADFLAHKHHVEQVRRRQAFRPRRAEIHERGVLDDSAEYARQAMAIAGEPFVD